MKAVILLIAVSILAIFAWSLSRLSGDAIALMMGLTLGVLSMPVTLWTLSLGARRDNEDVYYAPTVYRDQVTPYTHVLRNVAGMPQLPDRQLTREQIADTRRYLDYIEANEVTVWNQY